MTFAVDLNRLGSLDAVRAAVGDWLEDNFPRSLRTPEMQELYYQTLPRYPEGPDWALWKDRIVALGWGAPSWPGEYGGGGLDPVVGHAVAQEILRFGAFNPVIGMGITMLGPTLLEFGTPQQKAEHLPRITRGEVRWCQGYSEPGAGSDLAALKTRAEDAGDHFMVTGQKIWTTHSQYADWCFCLVRTDTTRKHEGISFLLIDMHSPGVEVRPIRIISGNSPFSEVFFTGVKVPKANLVGELNKGWGIAKRLLQHERNAVSNHRQRFGGDPRPVEEVARDYVGLDGTGRLADPDLRGRLIRNLMDQRALLLLQLRLVAEAKSRKGPSEATSVVKNVRAKYQQARDELLIEIMGYRGLGSDEADLLDTERDTTRAFLANKAMSIYSGSTEIQNNIIVKRILGLPGN